MPISSKHGRVTTQFGSFEDDEPVVVFRARDEVLPFILAAYYGLCRKAGSNPYHLELIETTLEEIVSWQRKNASLVHVPDSKEST
jgi:hypothetical protein